jgi:single-stranded-DNA-specific exonuclease
VNAGLRFVEQQVDLENERVLVVHGENWHVGVIGIVASKIMEMYDRPVIVLSEFEKYAKGSARSLLGFNMYEALERCRMHLLTFGGHPFAAGLQLSREKIPAFREAINCCAREMLAGADISPMLTIDTEVRSHEVGRALIQEMGMLEPHGPQNPAPVFSMKGLNVGQNPRIVGTNHLKLHLGQNGKAFSAIGFNMGAFARDLHQAHGALVDIAFVPTLNTFGLMPATVELELKDVRIQAPS